MFSHSELLWLTETSAQLVIRVPLTSGNSHFFVFPPVNLYLIEYFSQIILISSFFSLNPSFEGEPHIPVFHPLINNPHPQDFRLKGTPRSVLTFENNKFIVF